MRKQLMVCSLASAMAVAGCLAPAPSSEPTSGGSSGGADSSGGSTGSGGTGTSAGGTGTATGSGTDTGSDPGNTGSGSTGSGTGTGETGSGTGTETPAAPKPDPLDSEPDPLVGLKTGAAQLADLCARKGGDAVSKAFCASATPPTITSLVDLQKLLGLAFVAGNNANGRNGNPAFTLTGHSSSLVTKSISAINPRAIIFTPPRSSGRVNNPQPLASFVSMGFARGEQLVELVSNDPTANNGQGDLSFFLLKFEQACNAKPGGCTNQDLLTPAVESGFTGYTLYQDVDVKNTILDCLQCHQTGGPGTAKTLRMQELQDPWGHFFRNNRNNGQVMLADYATAHAADETYAGIPGGAIDNSDPALLEGLVENQGFKNQPNEFVSRQVLDKGVSQAWLSLYTKAMTGGGIPVPYHENRVTDPTKLQTAATAYKAAIAGTAPLTVDLRDVFLDAALPDMTFRPSKDLVTAKDGRGILIQMCQQCHNPTLDQTLSRALFDVTKLDTLSRAEKDKAIFRLGLADTAFRKMPPERFRVLSDDERQLVIDELKK